MTEGYRTEHQSGRAGPTFWAAPEIAKAGYPVFPLKDKAPSVAGGFYAATTDPSQIARWIEEGRESHDIAFATGIVSGVVVVEADTPEAYTWMEQAYGPPQVKTRRGGHWYFRHPKDGKVVSTSIRRGLDRKADGGYVAVPPSTGKRWVNGLPNKDELAVLPPELRGAEEQRDKPGRGAGRAEDMGEEIPNGSRNKTLTSIGGSLRHRGLDETGIRVALLAINAAKCKPPLSGQEVEKIAASVSRYAPSGNGAGGDVRSDTARPTDPEDLPAIVVNDRPLRDVGDDALRTLEARNAPPVLFARAGKVIRLAQDENAAPIIQEAGEPVIRHHLARAANFVHLRERRSGVEETHVNPPRDVVQDVLSVPHLPFPPLIGVPRAPFFRPDGTVVTEPGYDAATRLYYVPAHDGFAVEVSERPSGRDITAAVALIDEAVGDFPYVDAASAANTIALLLTPIMRNVIPGPVPLALIDKPTPGTGGSLLAEVVSLIATGSPAGMMSAPRDDEEVRKQITSALLRGNLVLTLDNVDGVLNAPSLSRALTSEFWEDRVLGRSEMIRVPQRATWLASGNNLQVGGDLPRRGYWIRLDARVERPWERGGFRHPHLKPWTTENRAALVSALLTLGRAWFVEGKPSGAAAIGGFEGWAHAIGGVLEVAGVAGFLGNLDEMYERAADGTRDWCAFLEAWKATYADAELTTKQLAAALHDGEHGRLREALPDEFGTIVPEHPDKGLSRKLGKAFARREGRRHGPEGLHLVRAGSTNNATRWTVRIAPEGTPERISLISLISFSPPSRARPREERSGAKQTKETHKLIQHPATSGSEHDRGAPTSPEEAAPRGEVTAFLADPPEWLDAQLVRCREAPERLLNPTATAIANALYNSPARWREVRPVLEEHLRGGAPAA